MFTGLVEGMAQVAASDFDGVGLRLTLDLRELSEGVRIGDSICVSGCCLTVIAIDASLCTFELGSETLSKTNFLSLKPDVVTGHVDGLGELQSRRDEGEWAHFYFSAAKSLLRQMVPKGSITINGVSLTVVDATDETFSIALIPHTLEVTTLGRLQINDKVHLETDILAKYVQRAIAPG